MEERETGSLARDGLFVVLVPDHIEQFTGGVECQTIFLYQDVLHYNALAGPLDDAGSGCAISPGCDLGGEPDYFAIRKTGKVKRKLLKTEKHRLKSVLPGKRHGSKGPPLRLGTIMTRDERMVTGVGGALAVCLRTRQT